MHDKELTLDLESLCGLQEGQELVIINVHLPSIHVVDDSLKGDEGDILQEYDRLFVSLLTEEILQKNTINIRNHATKYPHCSYTRPSNSDMPSTDNSQMSPLTNNIPQNTGCRHTGQYGGP